MFPFQYCLSLEKKTRAESFEREWIPGLRESVGYREATGSTIHARTGDYYRSTTTALTAAISEKHSCLP